jgi:hypothetical protein
MAGSRGKLLLGAKPIARHAFKDEERWRSIYNEQIRRELGLFMLGNRVAGYTGIIDARLNAKIPAGLADEPGPASRRGTSTATICRDGATR